jgi:ABC-type multidrug transport system fused ATPase/permease subunit
MRTDRRSVMEGVPLQTGYPSLAFRDLAFAYPRSTVVGGTGTRVFDDFSWATPAGATVILGPNGAGKTTLLSRDSRNSPSAVTKNPRRRSVILPTV